MRAEPVNSFDRRDDLSHAGADVQGYGPRAVQHLAEGLDDHGVRATEMPVSVLPTSGPASVKAWTLTSAGWLPGFIR